MDTVRYVLAVLIVSWLPPAMLWWLVVHPFVEVWRRIGPRRTLSILGALAIACIVGLTMIRDRLVGADLGTHAPLVFLAVALAVVSTWIAVTRRKHLTTRILIGIPELERDSQGTLLTEGLYEIGRAHV